MTKRKLNKTDRETQRDEQNVEGNSYQHHRGEIKDNALKALVTDRLFRVRVEKPKKGKGSYSRKGRSDKGQRPFLGLGIYLFLTTHSD
ncbi:ribosome alternative rescue factor ArfA [Veronia pacifica]|uniref:Alternative ribosome-rescue factor A n=1 Tax=Veronia pacifica TaxID=1080227 RepID=A0A1C3EKJ7_9GAMM|nr:ribosome alternative rescue factor ArfA [Veronia pacifica]ODA33761.1 hypothetical protein A8L45_08995 [Veronia pacifica]